VQFLAADEADQIIETDDAAKPDDDEDMGADEPVEEELTEEEVRQRAEQDAKAASMGQWQRHKQERDRKEGMQGQGTDTMLAACSLAILLSLCASL